MSGWDGKSGLALPPVPYKLKSSVYGSKQAEIWFATKMAGATDRDPSWSEEGVEEMLDTASNTGPRVDEGGNIVN